MKFLVDTQTNKILKPRTSPPQSSNPHLWPEWLRSGRAIIVEAEVIPEVAVYNGTAVVADPQRQQIYQNLLDDIQLLLNTPASDINAGNILNAVRVHHRILKFLVKHARVD